MNSINLTLIVSAVILGATILITLISALVCSRKKLPYSLSRIGCAIVAAVFSVIGAKSLRDTIGARLYDLVLRQLDGETLDVLTSVNSLDVTLETLISLLLAPILFLGLFLTLFTLLGVISGVVLRILHLASDKKQDGDEPRKNCFLSSGLWIGAAHGLLLSAVIFIPLCGYLSVVADTTEALQGSISEHYAESDKSEILESDVFDTLSVIQKAADSPFVQIIHGSVGKPIFRSLTSETCHMQDGTSFSLQLDSDLPQLGRIVGTALCLADRMDEDEDTSDLLAGDDRVLLEETCDVVLESELVSVIGADLIKTVATNWREDKPFAGISAPDAEPVLKPTIQVALDIFKTENADLLKDDVHTTIELLEIIYDSGILDDGLSNEDIMALLGSSKGQDSVIKSVQNCLSENEHMSPLAEEINSLSVRVVALVLDQSGLNDGKYDDALNSVAATVNEVVQMPKEERSEYIKVNVKEALDEHDEIDIPDDVAVALCEKVIADFAAMEKEITGESLRQYLIDHAAELTGEVGEYIPDDFDPDDIDPDDIDDYIGGATN